MYISRIELNPNRGKTRSALASAQILHAAIETCFPAPTPEDDGGRKLWRIDPLRDKLYLLVVSSVKPEFNGFAEQFCSPETLGETKAYEPFLNSIKDGQRFHFRFRGNPVYSKALAGVKRGKVSPHTTVAQKCGWFQTKAQTCGFSLEEGGFQLVETGMSRFFRKAKERPVEISYAVFEGRLTVTDATLFVNSLTHGIGRAKAYGCGMLTVVRPV